MKGIIPLTILLLVGGPSINGSAGTAMEGPDVYTLENSLEIAFQKSQELLRAEKGLEEMKAMSKSALSSMFPTISTRGYYTYTNYFNTLRESGFTFPQDTRNRYRVRLTLEQPIYKGGALSSSYDITKLEVEWAQEEVREIQHELLYNVTESFYDVILAEEMVAVKEQALEQAQLHLKDVQQRYEAGIVPYLEVLTAQVGVANNQLELIRAQNSVEMNKRRLINLLGVDKTNDFRVESELSYQPEEVDLETCLTQSLSSSPRIRKIRLEEEISKRSVDLAKAEGRPNLSLRGGYILENAINIEDRSPWEVTHAGTDDWGYGWDVGVTVDIPLFNSFRTRHEVKAAKVNQVRMELEVEQVINEVMLEVEESYLTIQEVRKIIDSQVKNMMHAEEYLRTAKISYENERITSLALREAQLSLSQTRINYLQSLYDHIIAKAALDRAIGKDR